MSEVGKSRTGRAGNGKANPKLVGDRREGRPVVQKDRLRKKVRRRVIFRYLVSYSVSMQIHSLGFLLKKASTDSVCT